MSFNKRSVIVFSKAELKDCISYTDHLTFAIPLFFNTGYVCSNSTLKMNKQSPEGSQYFCAFLDFVYIAGGCCYTMDSLKFSATVEESGTEKGAECKITSL